MFNNFSTHKILTKVDLPLLKYDFHTADTLRVISSSNHDGAVTSDIVESMNDGDVDVVLLLYRNRHSSIVISGAYSPVTPFNGSVCVCVCVLLFIFYSAGLICP